MRDYAEEAEVIHFFASTFIDTGINYKDKKVVAQHGGATYRENADGSNNVFNPIANATIMQYPTLLNKEAANEHLIYYPVDTEFLQPHYERNDKQRLIVSHYPSSVITKGSSTVMNVITELSNDSIFKKRFRYLGEKS